MRFVQIALGAVALAGLILSIRLGMQVRELEARLVESTARTGRDIPPPAGADPQVENWKAEAMEVHRLRSEVGGLREKARELEKLKKENAEMLVRLNASSSRSAAEPLPTSSQVDYMQREQWTWAGHASPESALMSAIWAMREGKPQAYFESLSPTEQQRLAVVWQTKSEAEIAAGHQRDVANIAALRILDRQPVSATEVQMNVYIEGAGRLEKVSMQRVGNDWKFGGFVRPAPR